jgi:hypothetical protein
MYFSLGKDGQAQNAGTRRTHFMPHPLYFPQGTFFILLFEKGLIPRRFAGGNFYFFTY